MGLCYQKDMVSPFEKKSRKKFSKQIQKNILAKPGPFKNIIILDNLKTAFNIGKITRSANAFGCQEIYLIGTQYFNPAPAKGALKHTPITFFQSFDDAYEKLLKNNYSLFAMDPNKATSDICSTNFPDKSAFIFGHEQFGFSFAVEEYKKIQWLKIKQYGHVESLNVACAATCLMYEYSKQFSNKENSAPPS